MRPGAFLFHGDARELPLADASVQCVVTSPPYWGLRDYGLGSETLGLEPTPELYVEHLVEIFREVRRVLRADGTCWVNLGDSYASDVKGSGGISHSPLFHATAETGRSANGQVAAQRYAPRRVDHGLKPKDLVGIPWRVAFALQADGWWLRSDIIWAKPNPMPESITDRPTKSHEYLFLLTKAARYYYDGEAIKEPATMTPQRRWNGDGIRGEIPGQPMHNGSRGLRDEPTMDRADRNRRSVWTIATEPYPEAHFATFPEKLVEPCILAGTQPGDRVLDPFAGSGTTVAVAERLGRVGIGVELKPAYLTLARQRTIQMGLL
jgi:DNA modification methylase